MPAIPATGSIGTRATRPVITWTRWRATDTRTCTGVRSGRRRCLIGWSRSGPRSDCQPDREHPGRWLGLSPARSPARGEFLVASDREDTLKKAEKLLRQGGGGAAVGGKLP